MGFNSGFKGLIKRPCYGTTLNLSLQEVCRIQYFRTWSGLSILDLQCNWLALGKTWNIRKENFSSENISSAQASFYFCSGFIVQQQTVYTKQTIRYNMQISASLLPLKFLTEKQLQNPYFNL